jgi:hypothetical protein
MVLSFLGPDRPLQGRPWHRCGFCLICAFWLGSWLCLPGLSWLLSWRGPLSRDQGRHDFGLVLDQFQRDRFGLLWPLDDQAITTGFHD